jgi:UrcA family protein
MYRKTLSTIALSLLTIATGCPATAQQISRVVQYRDLDLASPLGAQKFRHRLQRAIDLVCRRPDPAHPMTGAQDQDCRKEVAGHVRPRMLEAIELAEARAAAQIATR